jgi:competence protein ComEC
VLSKGFRKRFMDIAPTSQKIPLKLPAIDWAALRDLFFIELAAQKKQVFIWSPVFLSLGIGFYFSLPAEPPLVLGGFAFLLAACGFYFLRSHTPALLLFLMITGFFAAQLRTHIVFTPILQKEIKYAMIEGTIDVVEDFGDTEGSRLILSHVIIEDLSPEQTPRKIRLKVRADHGMRTGERIRVLGGLDAPSAPLVPGGFDFQRHLFFQGIGAVGFAFKNPEVVYGTRASGFNNFIEKQREFIAQRIEMGMKYPEAAVAIALTVGRMTAIDKEEQELWRDSGLAHALSISGLHVGMFSGIVFFIVRLLLVLIPGVGLRLPIKKIAAIVAMSAACYYMFLAGATVPTQRSVLMTGIVLLAVVLDRSPISLRLVSFAAFAVLLFFPESLLSASFQMSFAAVTCLVLFYDWLRPYWREWHAQAGLIRRIALYFASVCFTTLIASAATAPLGLFHFQQFATYGLMGNLVGVPIMAFLIMPAIVAVFLLIPFRLEFLAFYPLRLGIDWTIDVVHWVAALPYADIHAPSWPLPALISMLFAGLIFALFRTKLKYACLPLLVFAFCVIASNRPPNLFVADEPALTAFYTGGGILQVSSLVKARFARERWLQYLGLEENDAQAWPQEGGEGPVRCDDQACRIAFKGYIISHVRQPIAGQVECAQADVVIAEVPLPECDASYVVDLFDARDKGAHAFWLNDNGIIMRDAATMRGNRPWSSLNQKF